MTLGNVFTGKSLPSSKKCLQALFYVQIAIAVLLFSGDFTMLFSSKKSPQELVRINTPISPGDQQRPFTKKNYKQIKTNSEPSIPLPELDEKYHRLKFTIHASDEYGKILLVSQAIASGDAKRFETYIDELGYKPDIIALHSPGGLVLEALELGRLIRNREFDTMVSSGGYCVSSCPYVLASGKKRIVSSGAQVGVHQHYFDQPGYLPIFLAVDKIQSGQGKTMEYLKEMGIDPSIMIFGLTTPPDEIYIFLPEELSNYKLATAITE